MNNFIYYFYNMQVDSIIYNKKYYSFIYGGDNYKLYIIDERIDGNFLIQLEKRLLGNSLINEIIFNKDGEIVSNYNNIQYILMRIYVNEKKKITLNEINYLANMWIVKNRNINWAILWERKIDYLEKLINENGKKYPIITDSFNYFVGMAENAISYYNNITFTEDYYCVVSHKKIRFNDTAQVIYNPLNIILDYRVRDIAEYIKNAFFIGNKDIFNEIDLYLRNVQLKQIDIKLLVSRLLYPSFYFELYSDILIDNKNEKIILNIIDKLDEYELFLGRIIHHFHELYGIDEIVWLNNSRK